MSAVYCYANPKAVQADASRAPKASFHCSAEVHELLCAICRCCLGPVWIWRGWRRAQHARACLHSDSPSMLASCSQLTFQKACPKRTLQVNAHDNNACKMLTCQAKWDWNWSRREHKGTVEQHKLLKMILGTFQSTIHLPGSGFKFRAQACKTTKMV